MNAEQAWQSVLGHLQTEMPRSSFDTWVRDTIMISYHDGVMTVGVRNMYARDWLEERLLKTASNLLVEMLNHSVDLRFIVANSHDEIPEKDQDASKTATAEKSEEKGAGDDTLQVEMAESATRYANEVQPDRIVAPYAYAFRLIWFGDMTPKQFSLWIAFRQAVYSLWKKHNKNVRNIPWQDVCQYANMSRASFFREIGTLNLPNIVERIEIQKEKTHFKDSKGRFRQIANLYRVHMDPPLVKADAAALLTVLQERARIEPDMPAPERIEHALAAIKSLEGEDVASFLANLPEGNDPIPEVKNSPGPTVLHVVHTLTSLDGELPDTLRCAAEALHQRIIAYAGIAPMTLYFLEKVARFFKLTHAQTWLVAQLRKRCFVDEATGEIRDWTFVQGGYRTLARWAGVSPTRPTIWEWLHNSSLAAFVVEIKPDLDEPEFKSDINLQKDAERLLKEWDETDTRVFGVRLNEPLLSQLNCYASETPVNTQVRRGSYGNETPDLTEMRLGDNGDETHSNYASETPNLTEMRLHLYANETHFKLFKILRPTLKNQINSTNLHDSKEFASLTEWVAALAPKRWVLQKLFNNAHVSITKQRELLNADPKAFISWLLYAFSQDSIAAPVNYALKQLSTAQSVGAGGVYDDLAAYSPIDLILLAAQTSGGKRRWPETPDFSNDAIWDSTIGPTNPRIGPLFYILTSVNHPSPGSEKVREIRKTEYE